MDGLPELLGRSAAIVTLRRQVGRLLGGASPAYRLPPLLLLGETGTGKGLLARAIHRAGPRAAGPFVELNCAAIPETLLEAELFGFERGAFTDARQAKAGLFQTADRGTIFLDEVGLLPGGLQAKLLTVLEERRVRRLGATRVEPIDVCIIAATNADLGQAIAAGAFREDLYHRLGVVTLTLPPLRQRGEDVELLADHFLGRACAEYGLGPKQLSVDARRALLSYRWPGNIRELANAMERAALLSDGLVVTAPMLGLPGTTATPPHEDAGPPAPTGSKMDDAVRERLHHVLDETGWNISRAAARLGISRNTVKARIARYRLAPAKPPLARSGARPHPDRAARGVEPAPAATVEPATFRWDRRRVCVLWTRTAEPPGPDPSATWLLTLVREKAGIFGGRVEEVSPTGVLAVFGVEPVDQATVLAADAALAIHKATERDRAGGSAKPHLKSVIHTAQVLVGTAGRHTVIAAEDKRAAWNLLEAALDDCAPDAIAVTSDATPFLDRRFELAPRAGIASTHRLVALGVATRPAHTAFVGRQHELELLVSRFEAVAAGKGQVVGIVGDPGIGKSRLVAEFRRAMRGRQAAFLEAQAMPYAIGTPYSPIIQIVRNVCRIREDDDPETITKKVRTKIRDIGGDLEDLWPYVLHLLGMREGSERLAALTAEAIQRRIFEVLNQLCLRSSRHRPLVVIVDDLHWADAASTRYFTSLVDVVALAPILVLSTSRPGYQLAWGSRSYATQIALPPLTAEESHRLVVSVVDRALDARLMRRLLAKGEGNPFFLEELARVVRADEPADADVHVPDTVHDVIQSRVHRLADGTRTVLEAAAVLGRDVRVALLAAVVPDVHVDAELRELARLEFLYADARRDETAYCFKHALTQEVVYDTIPDARRGELHTAALAALEEAYAGRLEEAYDRLAHHASRARAHAKAADYFTRFAEQAARSHAHVESMQALADARRHLEELGGEQSEAPLLAIALREAHSLYFVARVPEALELLLRHRERFERAGNPRLLGGFQFILGQTYSLLGANDRAIECELSAIEHAARCDDRATLGRAHYTLAYSRLSIGDFEEALACGRTAIAYLADTDERWFLGMSQWVIGLTCTYMGLFDKALDALTEALGIAARTGDARLRSFAKWASAGVYAMRGEWEPATDASRRALEDSTDEINAAYASAIAGVVHLERGEGHAAIPLLEAGVVRLARFRIRQVQGFFTIRLGEAHYLAGDTGKGRDLVTQALQICLDSQYRYGIGLARRALGSFAATEGALGDAMRDLAEAEEILAGTGARFEAARTQLRLADVAWRTGDRERAAVHLVAAYRTFRELRVPRYEIQAAELARTLGLSLT